MARSRMSTTRFFSVVLKRAIRSSLLIPFGVIRRGAGVFIRRAGLAVSQQDHITDFTPPRPVLLLVGEHDEVTPPANSQAIAAAWPGAQVRIIPGAGHLFFIEQADAANQAILDFLKG